MRLSDRADLEHELINSRTHTFLRTDHTRSVPFEKKNPAAPDPASEHMAVGVVGLQASTHAGGMMAGQWQN
jgi:hypothetical protein